MIEAKFEENDRWDDVVRQAIDVGLEKIGIFVKGQAKSRAPIKTGQLKGSIDHEVKGEQVAVFTNVEYGAAIEFGLEPMLIKVKNKKVLSNGKTFFGKSVIHPGTNPQPFLRPSIFGNVDKINNIMARELASKL